MNFHTRLALTENSIRHRNPSHPYSVLSETKSAHMSRTLLCVLADLSNDVVEMVTILPLISCSSRLLGIVHPRHPHVPGVFFLVVWQGASICLSPRFLLFLLYGPQERQHPQNGKFSFFSFFFFFFFLFINIRCGLLHGIGWSIRLIFCISKSYSLGFILVWVYSVWSDGQI